MRIIGCDYHPSWQQVCWVDTETGEAEERTLDHASGEAEKFYRQQPGKALIGMESTGNCQWFVEMGGWPLLDGLHRDSRSRTARFRTTPPLGPRMWNTGVPLDKNEGVVKQHFFRAVL